MTLLRFAFRKILQQPLYALLAIGTLGIGIGAVATCFSAVNTMLFRPLPGAGDAERMIWISQTMADDKDAAEAPHIIGLNYADALEFKQRTRHLESVWLHTSLTVIVAGESAPLRFLGTRIDQAAFDAIRVQPTLGRNFIPADVVAGAEPVALFSDKAWQDRFGRDPGALDSVVEINGVPTRIVGIMPPGWRYPEYSDVWLPLSQDYLSDDNKVWSERGYFFFDAHANLAPGSTLSQATAELEHIAAELAAQYPETNDGIGVAVGSWRSTANRDALYFTLLLFGAGIAIFLISCANIANLQLARGSDRGPEIAVRLALGATRGRIFRQLAVENLVLGLLGSAAGIVIALWGMDGVMQSLNIDAPFWLRLDPDWRVLLFTAGAGVAASFIFGLAPAWRDSHADVTAGLKESSRTGMDQGLYGQRLRNGIVVAEIALALVLLVGAGLMTRSFLKLRAIDLGYESNSLLTFRVGFPVGYAQDEQEMAEFFATLPRRLEQLPEVEHAGAITQLPGTGSDLITAALVTPENAAAPTDALTTFEKVAHRAATAGYFSAVGVPLLAGRDFTDGDTAPDARELIVDSRFAAAAGLTPAEIIGRRILSDSPKARAWQPEGGVVVGVVGAIRDDHNQPDSYPTLYTSHRQAPPNFMSIALRTRGDPAALAATIGNEVLGVHAGMPIYDVLTGEQRVLQSIWQQYFFSRLFLCAGIIAVVLACIGIYGVMTFAVTMRRHEIGLRMALGAPASEVVGEVVRKGLHLVVLGLGSGFLAASALASLLAGNLYGITPHDPPTFVIVPALLAAVAIVACYLSSWRATRIDPMTAMRAD